jgi:hypothetical protein
MPGHDSVSGLVPVALFLLRFFRCHPISLNQTIPANRDQEMLATDDGDGGRNAKRPGKYRCRQSTARTVGAIENSKPILAASEG